jgi:hypothetical protein
MWSLVRDTARHALVKLVGIRRTFSWSTSVIAAEIAGADVSILAEAQPAREASLAGMCPGRRDDGGLVG